MELVGLTRKETVNLCSNFSVDNFQSEHLTRNKLLELFLKEINTARLNTKYKPLTIRAIAIKLAQSKVVSEHELYMFYQDCKRAKSFSAYFFWSLKV